MQPLVSSFSAGGRLVQSLAIAQDGHLQRKTIPVAAYIYSLHHWPPEDERMTLETCRGTYFYVIYKIVYQVGINKRIILWCTANQISRREAVLNNLYDSPPLEVTWTYTDDVLLWCHELPLSCKVQGLYWDKNQLKTYGVSRMYEPEASD
jgi:hypothetical protein